MRRKMGGSGQQIIVPVAAVALYDPPDLVVEVQASVMFPLVGDILLYVWRLTLRTCECEIFPSPTAELREFATLLHPYIGGLFDVTHKFRQACRWVQIDQHMYMVARTVYRKHFGIVGSHNSGNIRI